VRGDVGQAQRTGVLDQQPEQAASFWPVVDPPDLFLAQADRDELGQQAVLSDDAQRPVGRVYQADRGLDDPPEGGFQVQAGADRDHCLEQAAHPVRGRQDRGQTSLQLGEELIQLQAGLQFRTAHGTRFHGWLPPGDGAWPE